MEYIEHGDLGQYIKEYQTQAKGEAQAIATQLLEGLVVLHGRGICHRDIKPQVITLRDQLAHQTDTTFTGRIF